MKWGSMGQASTYVLRTVLTSTVIHYGRRTCRILDLAVYLGRKGPWACALSVLIASNGLLSLLLMTTDLVYAALAQISFQRGPHH